MKKRLILMLLLIPLLITITTASNHADIKITELMYDPPNVITGTTQDLFRCVNDSSCQWIEIFNNEDTPVDLANYKIQTTTGTYDFTDIIIQPKQFLVITTQLGDEDLDGFSFSTRYGNKDGIWDATDGFNAVDSDIPFFKTADIGPSSNPYEEIRLIIDGDTVSILAFFAHYQGPDIYVQKNNGYTMEQEFLTGKYLQSTDIGGSPGEVRNSPPNFTSIPEINLQEDYNFENLVLNISDQKLNLLDYVDDADNNTLTFNITAQTNPSLLSCQINSSSNILCSNPAENQFGESILNISASDSKASAEASFVIEVIAVNDAPNITSTPTTTEITINNEFSYQITAEDIESNEITYSFASEEEISSLSTISNPVAGTAETPGILSLENGMKINSTTGLFTWTPSKSQIGTHKVTIKAKDFSDFSTQEITLKVNPILDYQQINLQHGSTLVENINETDNTVKLVKTNEKITLNLTTINRHNKIENLNVPIEDIQTSIKLKKGSIVIHENVSIKDFNLNSLETEEELFEFTIPRNTNPGTYELEITSSGLFIGLNEDLTEFLEDLEKTFTIDLDISTSRHDTYISNIEYDLNDDNISITTELSNTGLVSESDITLTLQSNSLNFLENINLPRLFAGTTTTQTIEFPRIVGQHAIVVSILYNENLNADSKIIDNIIISNIPGDFNFDSCVNHLDRILIEEELRNHGTNKIFDLNNDKRVTFSDYNIMADNFDEDCNLQPQDNDPIIITPNETKKGITLDKSLIKTITFQNTVTESTFTITNENNESVITPIFEITGLDELTLNLDQKTILPTASEEFTLTATISELDFKVYTGQLKIITPEETKIINLQYDIQPSICSSLSDELEVIIHEPGNNEDVEPGDTIDIEFTVKNKGTSTKEVTAEVILYNLDDDKEVEDEIVDEIDISSKSSERDDFDTEITIPDNDDIGPNDDVAIIIRAYEEGKKSSVCTQEINPINIDRENIDIKIKEFDVPEKLSCNKPLSISLSLENSGKKDDDTVKIKLEVPELNIFEESSEFEIEKYTKDNKVRKFFTLNPENLENKKYTLTTIVEYDDGDEITTDFKTFEVIGCEEIIEEPIKIIEEPVQTQEETFTISKWIVSLFTSLF